MINISFSRRDVGRLLSVVREKRRKFERGMRKFEDNFDPDLGANIQAGFNAYYDLEKTIASACSAGRDPEEHEDGV